MLVKKTELPVPALILALLIVSLTARIGAKLWDKVSLESQSGLHWKAADTTKLDSDDAKKLLLINFTDNGSQPCIDVKRTVFSNRDVISLLNEKFECIKVVTSIHEENNAQLMSKYDIQHLPAIVVALPDGSEISRHVGYLNARQLLHLLNESIEKTEFAHAQSLMIKGRFVEAERHLLPLSDIDWTLYGPKHTAMLYWHILRSRGKTDEVRRVLDKAEDYALRNAKGYVFDEWPRQHFQFMRGERTDAELTQQSSKHSKYDYSDALCAIALKQLQNGDKERAKYDFLSVMKAGCTRTFSYDLAQRYLQALTPDKAQP